MQFGVTGYRDLTTSFQSTQKCPFGHHPLPGGPITYGFHKGPDAFVVLANFETHGPLTYSRQHGTDGQILRNEVLQSEPLNARPGHNQSLRSEERRVGKECRSRWARDVERKKK